MNRVEHHVGASAVFEELRHTPGCQLTLRARGPRGSAIVKLYRPGCRQLRRSTDSGARGLPTSVLEAMALGLPVVTTAVNGLVEAVVHQQTGIVVPARDPSSLADALELLLGDRELRERLAHGARSHVEEYFALDRNVLLLRSLFPEEAA